jgi:hypothetical protein
VSRPDKECKIKKYTIDRIGSVAVGLKLLNYLCIAARAPSIDGESSLKEYFHQSEQVLLRLNEQMLNIARDGRSICDQILADDDIPIRYNGVGGNNG